MGSRKASAGKGGAAAQPVSLPADARLGALDELKALLAEALQGPNAQLDGTAVERVDGASLQLLVAFRRAAAAGNCAVTWLGVSTTLRDAAALLGLTDELDLPAPTPA